MKTSHDVRPASPPWHTQSVDRAAEQLGVDPTIGLDEAEALRRLQEYGPNEIEEGRVRPRWRILIDQFTDWLILVLLAAAVVSGLVGEPADSIAILAIVVLNAVFGAFQEYRADRALAALREMSAPSARVTRGGARLTTAMGNVVPGDVVWLEAGDVVPADLRLVEAHGLQIEEAALTGESVPVEKLPDPLEDETCPLGDRFDMAFRGTLVTRGRGQGLAVATGMATEIGHVASLLGQGSPPSTPLQRRLAVFSRRLAVVVLLVCAIVFASGILRGEPVSLMFLTAVTLAVAAVPEALPAVVSIALALGSRAMVEHHALVRRLSAAESLGSVTYVCSDKTGTLTENRMRLEWVWADGEWRAPSEVSLDGRDPTAPDPWVRLFCAMTLCNDAQLDADEARGDPTEVALLQAAEQGAFPRDSLEEALPRVSELAFDASRKRMSTLHRYEDGILVLTKGAPEAVLAVCRARLGATGEVALDSERLLDEAELRAGDGYRVLALAQRRLPDLPAVPTDEAIESELVFVGLVALIDPPRSEVSRSVERCRSAGIEPVMITGDHPATGLAIARRLGIAERPEQVVEGRTLAQWNEEELAREVQHLRVYARVSPEQKVRIVEALQANGELVAMTGDGVNDAPSLRCADIGVAMGRKGTDVAREAADMVLLDDNFATIVTAVGQGRRIFDNIRKFIRYTMTSNSGEIWTLFLAPFFGLPIPLLPIQILWINLVTDGLPGLALAVEPEERDVMSRPPRPPQESIFARGLGAHALVIGLLIGGLSLGAQYWAYHGGSDQWRTLTFTVLTFAQLAHAMVIRSERDSLLEVGLFTNPLLLAAVALTVGLQLAVVYLPWLQPIFKTGPLTPTELALCFALPAVVVLVVELEKALVRRGLLYRNAAR